jgi:hypothetical protein
MANALPGTEITRSLFAFKAVEVLRAHGACDYASFEALRNTRPHRRLGGQVETIPELSLAHDEHLVIPYHHGPGALAL